MNGVARSLDFTEVGNTCFSASAGDNTSVAFAVSVVMMRSSGSTSAPDSSSQSRRIFCATGLAA